MRSTLLIFLLAGPIGLLAQNTDVGKSQVSPTVPAPSGALIEQAADAVPAGALQQAGAPIVVKEARPVDEQAAPRAMGRTEVKIEVDAEPLMPGSEPPQVERRAVPADPVAVPAIRQEVEVEIEAQPVLRNGQ